MESDQLKPLTEIEAADRLGLSVATLRAWRMQKRGPRFVRFGRCVRYLPADVQRFIDDCVVETTDQQRLPR